jgi:hypothetical protein
MTDWGVPDWTDPSTYGDASQWSGSRWRWEFTRRREDYRDDFDTNAQWSLDQLSERSRSNPAKRFLGRDDPGFVASGSCGDARPFVEKYGLIDLPNPRISDQPFRVIRFEKRFGGVMRGKGPFRWHQDQQAEEETAMMLVPKGSAAALFDLSRPVNPQLETAKELLVELQKAQEGKLLQHRKHPKKWFTYLRVLDAKEAGATLSDIAGSGILGKLIRSNTVPEDGPQAAHQVLEAARHLMFNWPN